MQYVNCYNLIVYPQPASKDLFIKTSNANGVVSFILTNLSGQSLIKMTSSQSETVMDISYIAPGVYILQVQNNDSIVQRKIVKQ